MQALLKSFARRRHSRGFGIHSPFAYRFITEVLCLPHNYGYYAYALAGRDGNLRLLVRLLAFFSPASVTVDLGEGAAAVGRLVREVLPHAALNGPHPDFIISDKNVIAQMPCNAFLIGEEALACLPAIGEALPYGMTFAGRSCAVVAALPHLPRQDFELKL